MSIHLSILIVNWNTKELLRQCLLSIYQSTQRVNYEIIVVDNGSSDGSVEMVKETFAQVKLLQNQTNMGFAAANNQGIHICSGELVLLLNSDTRVLDGTIDACVDYMSQHPRTGVLGCKVLYPDGTFQSSYFRGERLRDLLILHCFGLHILVHIARRLGFKHLNYPSRYWGKVFSKDVEVDVVAGCFFLIRRRVISQVGPLDEEFFFYGEEEEWCFRIQRAGWSVVYFPYAQIIHIHGASSEKVSSWAALAARRARLIVLEKTRGIFAAWLGNVIMTCGVFIRLPFWLIADWLKAIDTKAKGGYFLKRRELIGFHLTALFKPAWRPTAAIARGEKAGDL